MLLSLDKPSPAAVAAVALLLLDAAAGDEEEEDVVAVSAGPPPAVVRVMVNDPSSVVAVPLAGPSMRVMVKFAGVVIDAEVLGRTQVVVGVVVQSVLAWVAWAAACWSGLGLVSCALARVVAPRAARMWEGRI